MVERSDPTVLCLPVTLIVGVYAMRGKVYE